VSIVVWADPAVAQATLAVNGVASPTVTVARPGWTVSIAITNGPGTATDWIGLYAVGASDYSYLDWRFMNSTQTAPASGQTSGAVNFPLPLTPGDYEFRFFANFTWQRVAVSGVVTAAYDTEIAVNGVVSPNATVARAGSTVSISITNGPGRAADCILLFAVGASDYSYLDWRFMNSTQTVPTTGQTSGTVSFPLPLTPGDYEFRLFANQTWQRVAASGIVTAVGDVVTPDPPAAGTIAYYHGDVIGSVRMVTDAAQGAVRYDYLPFGQEYPSEQAGQPRRFGGKERDAETTFDYFGARYFSSSNGRFTTPDSPLNDQDPSDPQSWSLYTYARNNPFRFIDPIGTTCVHTSGKNNETITTDDGDGKGCQELREPTVVRGQMPAPSLFMAVAIGAQRAEGPVNTIVAGAGLATAGIATAGLGALGGSSIITLGRLAALGELLAPAGGKMAQVIARLGVGQGNPALALQKLSQIRDSALTASTYVQGFYIQANATIYRVGNDYLTVSQNGRILSFVSNATPGVGVAQKYLELGGR
jgi:RHS repeat-associated protein